MITKEITLCGKHITLAYCYATEIAYKDLSGENISDYIQEAVTCIQQKSNDPDTKRTIFAILACMLAYYQSKGEDAPLKDSDLMNEADPMEIGNAIITIVGMRMDFYHIPKGEPQDPEPKTEEEHKKN